MVTMTLTETILYFLIPEYQSNDICLPETGQILVLNSPLPEISMPSNWKVCLLMAGALEKGAGLDISGRINFPMVKEKTVS